MDVNVSGGGDAAAMPSRLAGLVAVLRDNESFQIGATVVVVFMTIAGLIMQGADYAAHIHSPLALLGAAAGLAVPLAAITLLVLTWPPRRWVRWVSVAAVAAAVTLFLALLPPVTAGHGWLTIVVTVLVTLTYDVVAIAYLVIVRPWMWIPGWPD